MNLVLSEHIELVVFFLANGFQDVIALHYQDVNALNCCVYARFVKKRQT